MYLCSIYRNAFGLSCASFKAVFITKGMTRFWVIIIIYTCKPAMDTIWFDDSATLVQAVVLYPKLVSCFHNLVVFLPRTESTNFLLDA